MTEVEVKPKMLNYQRNGIGGDGFYVMVFDWADTDGMTGKNFIATFETAESDTYLKSNCRIVDPKHPIECWRGDVFSTGISYALTKAKKAYGVSRTYELQDIINNPTKKRMRA